MPAPSSEGEVKVIDIASALENLDGDVELLSEVVDVFLERGPGQLGKLEEAVTAGRIEAVRVQAHGLKGGAANFCGARFSAAALELEKLAASGSLDGAPELLARLRAEFERLQREVAELDWSTLAETKPVA